MELRIREVDEDAGRGLAPWTGSAGSPLASSGTGFPCTVSELVELAVISWGKKSG